MSRRLPSLNALRAFEAAGRHRRMTQAAEELHVTHSAISRQVQHLEHLLGVELFEGPKNALRLTDAGVRLMSGLTPAFDQLDLAVRSVADTEDGTLDVSCPGTFTMRWLIPRLYRFRAAYPAIEVRLSASSQPINPARDSFDVAIRAARGPWPDGMEVLTLFDEQIGPVVAPSLVQSVAEDLSAVPLLHSSTRRHAWADWSRQSGVAVNDRHGTSYEHFYFMLEAASAGLGVCIAPWPLVADDVRAGILVAPLGFIPNGQSYVALRRSRQHKKSALFCAWLAEEAKAFGAAPA